MSTNRDKCCVDSSTSTNRVVYESGQMWCRFVDIDESGCLPMWLSANRSATHGWAVEHESREGCYWQRILVIDEELTVFNFTVEDFLLKRVKKSTRRYVPNFSRSVDNNQICSCFGVICKSFDWPWCQCHIFRRQGQTCTHAKDTWRMLCLCNLRYRRWTVVHLSFDHSIPFTNHD